MIISSLLYILVGIIAGVLAGLLGIGGGVVVVPGLAFIFQGGQFFPDTIMHIAVGTSLAAMVVTAISSIYSHHQRGLILWPTFLRMLPGLIIGTIGGAIIAGFLSTFALKIIFGIFLLLVAVRLFAKVTPKPSRKVPSSGLLIVAGLIIGMLSGLLGVGGGVLVIPFLIYCNVDIRQASGTSAACGLPVAILGTLTFIITGWHASGLPAYSSGYVYWPAAIMIAIFSVSCVRLGAKLSKILPVLTIQHIFAVLLIITALGLLI